ncbi:antibiotic biosynthesis monooxygenase family protein [Tamlana sp. I1]|uniref:antibiotic biosynthesis monooxygenase family protein n=1 Tax=Tamlana sp. I1 TaxID=2762061 RepID=UPI00188F9383|nr:antibiotic biosynthesis monooxygenase [Tamlana sp. I1]
MYIVIYRFIVKQNLDQDFIKYWKGLTDLIYKYEGSLGSRLHKEKPNHYIAYAQWPSKTVFENSGGKLPIEANRYRDAMRLACEKIEISNKLEVIEDLLTDKIHV